MLAEAEPASSRPAALASAVALPLSGDIWPPLWAFTIFAGLLAAGLAPVVLALWFVDNRRPQWRDQVALVSQLTVIGILAFAAFSFLTGSSDAAEFIAGAVAATGVLTIALARWWTGHGKLVALVSVIGVLITTMFLVNPLSWAFVGLGMLWFVALLLAFLSAAVLGRRGRGALVHPAAPAPSGPACSPLQSRQTNRMEDETR